MILYVASVARAIKKGVVVANIVGVARITAFIQGHFLEVFSPLPLNLYSCSFMIVHGVLL